MPDRPVIVHVVNSLRPGGTERTLVALLRALDPHCFRHVVVTLREAGELAAQLPEHVACRALQLRGRARGASLQLARVTRARRATLIHARNTGCWNDALGAGLLTRGARVILGFHGFDAGDSFTAAQKLSARRGRWLGARFTAVSQRARRQLHAEARVPVDRITVLPNGVDPDRFARVTPAERNRIRAELRIESTDLVVATVGSLTAVKQPGVLLDAFSRARRELSQMRLVFVGTGDLEAELRARVRDLELTECVMFVGARDDVPQVLAAADVYVCASKSEGMSNSLLEALAAGCALVTTDVGDHAAIVRPEIEGLVVSPDSVDGLTFALLRLARAPDLRQLLAEAARRRARDYSFGHMVHAYERYYLTLAGGRRTEPGISPPAALEATCA